MTIEYEKKGNIAYMTINRPEVRNALTIQMFQDIDRLGQEFQNDPEAWVMILTGAGDKAFSAGADLKDAIPRLTASPGMGGSSSGVRFFSGVYKPIIAAVNGVAVAGGTEILNGTDIRIAAEHATFGITESRWSLVPLGGSCVRMPRHIPWCRAMEILLMADQISAQEALQIGLINKVVPLPELMPTAQKAAERICENGPLAVRTIKEIAVRSLSMPIEQGFLLESLLGGKVWQSEDAKEGPRAFAEKRKPVWRNR